MGKSAVLKDMSNRLAGYVILSGESAVCRAGLEHPAQLALVLSDGSQIIHTLDGGAGEQRFHCEGKEICGCYVFRGEELLLSSDEAMRRIFERQKLAQCISAAAHSESEQKAAQPGPQEEPPQREKDREKRHVFAQRRWPPPPCWETAVYLDGCWQEK